jgi:hypothetical protein
MSQKAKRPDPKTASSWIQGGQDHQPKHAAKMAEVRDKEAAANVRGGRPKTFEEPTERLNVMLPASMVQAIKRKALDDRTTPGQVLVEALKGKF